jgi:L-asparaginase II
MQIFGARVYVKIGAEGVYCGALPEQGLGIAIKCDDGAGRAAQAIMAALIARYLSMGDTERAALAPLMRPVLRNWNGFEVGEVRVTEPALAGDGASPLCKKGEKERERGDSGQNCSSG